MDDIIGGMRKLRFYYHFNKPQSTPDRIVWSVHHNGKCHFVNKIVCHAQAESKAQKRQLRAVMQGFCNSVEILNDTAIIR